MHPSESPATVPAVPPAPADNAKLPAGETVTGLVDGFRKVLPGGGNDAEHTWYTKHVHGEGR